MTGHVARILAVAPADAGAVEVLGADELAGELRRALGFRAASRGDARPAAVVETSGTPAGIAAALARVDDLGTVVLAGPAPARPLELDLYADVHVRGLLVLTLPAPAAAR